MKITRDNILDHLKQTQFAIIGKNIQEILLIEDWRKELYMSHEQFVRFEKYAIPLLKKTFKYNRKKAQSTFDHFRLYYGLKVDK